MSFHRTDTPFRTPTAARPVADLNVTPLIDVLLVLLIIFMIILPLSQAGLDVEVPETVSAPQTPRAFTTHVVAEYSADGVLTVNQEVVPLSRMADRFAEVYASRRDKTLFVIGAESVRYGEIMRIIDAAMGAGVDKVGVVTEGMIREARAGGG